MTKRIKLLGDVRKLLIGELTRYNSTLTHSQVINRMEAIGKLNKRLPHITMPSFKISSQQKLFY